MEHRDVEMSDIVVVADDCALADFDAWVITLKAAGVAVDEVDPKSGVVEGTIASALMKTIQALPCVKYVRSVFNYVADYPVGDPRNMDDEDELDEHIPR